MKADLVMFRRFVAESLGQIPDDLRGWALQVMLSTLSFEDRIAERDRALNMAAELLPANMYEENKIRRLSDTMRALSASALPANPDLTTVEGCLVHALLACRRALCEKQVQRRLTVKTFAPS